MSFFDKREKYVCPKCKSVVHSKARPEYCICGGKYEIGDLMQTLHDMFKEKNK
jgi:hypothetical protein